MTVNPKRILPILRYLALVVFLVSACAPQAVPQAQPAAGNAAAAATPAAAAGTPAPPPAVTSGGDVTPVVTVTGQQPFPDGTELKILQWSHFVPRYDQWFDQFAKDWGTANNVKVTVDHIDQA